MIYINLIDVYTIKKEIKRIKDTISGRGMSTCLGILLMNELYCRPSDSVKSCEKCNADIMQNITDQKLIESLIKNQSLFIQAHRYLFKPCIKCKLRIDREFCDQCINKKKEKDKLVALLEQIKKNNIL